MAGADDERRVLVELEPQALGPCSLRRPAGVEQLGQPVVVQAAGLNADPAELASHFIAPEAQLAKQTRLHGVDRCRLVAGGPAQEPGRAGQGARAVRLCSRWDDNVDVALEQ